MAGHEGRGLAAPNIRSGRVGRPEKHGRPRPMRGSSDRGLGRVATSRRAPSGLHTSCAPRYGVGQGDVCRKLKKCPTWGLVLAAEWRVNSSECGWVIGRWSRWRDPVSPHKGGPVAVASPLQGVARSTGAPRSGPAPSPGPFEGRHRANRNRPPPSVSLRSTCRLPENHRYQNGAYSPRASTSPGGWIDRARW